MSGQCVQSPEFDAIMQRHNDLGKRLANKGLTDQRRQALQVEWNETVKAIGRMRPDLVAIWDDDGNAKCLEIDLQA